MTKEGYKRHKELIEAWANGAEIELYSNNGWFKLVGDISWLENNEYRIKQEPVLEWQWKWRLASDQIWESFTTYLTQDELDIFSKTNKYLYFEKDESTKRLRQ